MKKSIVLVLIVVLMGLIGYCGLSFLRSSVTQIDTTSSIGELCEIVLSFATIVITIVLSFFVYNQAERINKLEIAQYDVFVGVESLDFNENLDTELQLISNPIQKRHNDVKLFKGIVNEKITLLAHVHMGDANEMLFIPFVFVTRNTPLITSLQLKKIDIALTSKKNELQKPKPPFHVDADPVHNILSDNSHFVLSLGVHGIGQNDVDKMKVAFEIAVTDQLKREHTFKTEVELSQIHTDIRLLSSKTSI